MASDVSCHASLTASLLKEPIQGRLENAFTQHAPCLRFVRSSGAKVAAILDFFCVWRSRWPPGNRSASWMSEAHEEARLSRATPAAARVARPRLARRLRLERTIANVSRSRLSIVAAATWLRDYQTS